MIISIGVLTMLKNITKTGLFLSLSLLSAATSYITASDVARIMGHYQNEQTRLNAHYKASRVHRYDHAAQVMLGIVAFVPSLEAALQYWNRCDSFQPTIMERRNARTQKKLAIKSQQNKNQQKTFNTAFRQASEVGMARVEFGGRQHLANQVMAREVASITAGQPMKSIKEISNSDIFLTKNDFPRYRKYKYAGMFCGASAAVSGAFMLYHMKQIPNYPEFVINDYVPNQR